MAWIRQRWSKQVGGTAPGCIGGQPNQTLPFFLLYKIFRLRLLPRLLMRLLTIVLLPKPVNFKAVFAITNFKCVQKLTWRKDVAQKS